MKYVFVELPNGKYKLVRKDNKMKPEDMVVNAMIDKEQTVKGENHGL